MSIVYSIKVKSSEEIAWGCGLDEVGSFRVTRVEEGFQMDILGVQVGDKLLKINGQCVSDDSVWEKEGEVQNIMKEGLSCKMDFSRPTTKRKREEGGNRAHVRKKRKFTLPQEHILSDEADAALVEDVQKFISNTWGFKALTDEGKELLTEIGKKHGATFDQTKATWKQKGAENARKNNPELKEVVATLPESGEGLLTLKIDVPGLNIVRRFLELKSTCVKKRIREIIVALSEGDPDEAEKPDELSDEIFEKFKTLAKLDAFTGKSITDRQRVMADKTENDICGWMTRNGIEFQTEDDIKSQLKPTQEPKATPDLLFAEPISINEYEGLNWLEIKNYYGTLAANEYRLESLKKQVSRYFEFYGKGLIVFRLGYCAGLPDTIKCPCLDARIDWYST